MNFTLEHKLKCEIRRSSIKLTESEWEGETLKLGTYLFLLHQRMTCELHMSTTLFLPHTLGWSIAVTIRSTGVSFGKSVCSVLCRRRSTFCLIVFVEVFKFGSFLRLFSVLHKSLQFHFAMRFCLNKTS